MPRRGPSIILWTASLFLAATLPAYGAQNNPSLTIAQIDQAAAHYTHGHIGQPLHTMDAIFRDGARGEDTWVSTELPSRRFAPFSSAADRALHADLCGSNAIVTGTLLDTTARLDSAGDMIVTLARFRIDDRIKSAPDMAPGTIITVIREGGEVADGGERLRLHVSGRDDFIPGQHYFLMLDPAPGLSSYFDAPFLTVHEVDGKLYPSTDRQGIPAGTPYQAVKARMRYLRTAFPCT